MFQMLMEALRRTDDSRHARPDTMAARARNMIVWLWTGSTASESGNGRHDIENRPAGSPTALQLVRRQARERSEARAWAAIMEAVENLPTTARERFDRRLAQADRAAEPARRAARQVVTHVAAASGPVRHRITQHATPAQKWARERFDTALSARRTRDATKYGRRAVGETGFMERLKRA
jgi:hypothetical protein